MSKLLEKAHQVAKEARKNAYAPYSKFQVGAALILENDEIIPGCNVENVSYGATVCAERTAILSAVSKGHRKFSGIVLVTEPQAVPCGQCLQVMSEFFSPSAMVYLADEKGIRQELPFGNLLPYRFDSEILP